MKRRKKKGKRLKNPWGKLIYLLFLIGSTILVSFRGGNISYLLFYFALLLPVLAFLYSLYVFNRFNHAQNKNIHKPKKKTHLYPFYPANIPSAFPIYNSSYPVWL